MLKNWLLLCLLSHVVHLSVNAKQPPNFIIILADDLGWTGTSLPSHPDYPDSKSDFYQTPNLERLAFSGMSFTNAYAPSPMCIPSRASLLTGKSPAQLHMTIASKPKAPLAHQKLAAPIHKMQLPREELTIAEILKKKSYSTAHYGKWHLGSDGPGEHGFDEHDGKTGNSGPGDFEDPNPKDIFEMTKRATSFISKSEEAGTPFYVQLSHYAVHSPSKARASSIEKFKNLKSGERHRDVDYAAMTYDLDASIGKLVELVHDLELDDNTYFMFLSDNGAVGKGGRANFPLKGGKTTLWEGGVRVPMIVVGPNVEQGSYSDHPVIGYDLFPTLLELAGLEDSVLDAVEGESFVDVLTCEPGLERAYPLVFHFPHYSGEEPQSSIIEGDYKLIKFYESKKVELYNLKDDISEDHDLSPVMIDKSEGLKSMLSDYLIKVKAQMPIENKLYRPSAIKKKKTKKNNVINMDANGDGKVSNLEFIGPQKRFKKLDKDNNGFLAKSEIE